MRVIVVVAALGLTLTSCGDDRGSSTAGAGSVTAPAIYTFESSFAPDESSVSYSGQTARQMLIGDLSARIGGLTAAVDGPDWAFDSAEEVYGYLDYFVNFDSDSDGADAIALTTTPPVLTVHSTYAGISSGKNLSAKLAGNDDATDHRDWDGGDFTGWSDASIASNGGTITSPAGLLEAFLRTLAARTAARADGVVDAAPSGAPLPVHVTPEGLDLQQLTQKLLLMAVNYSQGTDDYLDSDRDGKGLLAGQERDGDRPYTKLEHAWDEAWGYFGGARDYALYSDDELAREGGRDDWQGYHDTDGDGAISLTAEYNFGASTNAAKRDRGAAGSTAPTDFTADAWRAFATGRAIIASAAGAPLSPEQLAALEAQRDRAVVAWEGAIAATCVHSINAVLADISSFGGSYSFIDYARRWSELKGLSIGLQFNPRSRLSDAQHAEIQQAIGDRPIHPSAADADVDAYKSALRSARDVFMTAYGFPLDLKGDDDGAGGW